MIPLILITSFLAVGVGITVLWANPTRFTNRACCLISLIFALELWLIYEGVRAGQAFYRDGISDPIPWLRMNSAIGAFFAWALWLLKESIAVPTIESDRLFRRSLPWLGVGLLLSAIPFTQSFIPDDSRPNAEKRGIGYLALVCVSITQYLILVTQAYRQWQRQTGIRRTETLFLVLNMAIAATVSLALASLGNLLQLRPLKSLAVLMVMVAYFICTWSIVSGRVFDARQVFSSIGQRLLAIAMASLTGFVIFRVLSVRFQPPLDILLTIAVACSTAFWFNRKTRELLRTGGELVLAKLRNSVIALTRSESSTRNLVAEFECLFRAHCGTRFAALLFDDVDAHKGDELRFDKNRPAHAALCEASWATPESLERRRLPSGFADLQLFLQSHDIGLIVAVPRGSPTPSLLVVLGTKENQWPYSLPEIQRIENVAELMDNILTHSRLTSQAAMKTKMEHLAMMSRGLAHDLKNLITPVSSFLVHTERHMTLNEVESEVHAAAKRSVRVMTNYVRESLSFSERLEPTFDSTQISRIFESACEVTATRAKTRGVKVITECEPDLTLVADAVLLQRMLANLVTNAIDASTPGQVVTISAAPLPTRSLRLRVRDEGSGIAPQHLGRIFEPYFTTKEFGDEVRGFGLGLTICQRIVDLHHGLIAVETDLSRGTTVTVDLPLTQPEAPGATASARVLPPPAVSLRVPTRP